MIFKIYGENVEDETTSIGTQWTWNGDILNKTHEQK